MPWAARVQELGRAAGLFGMLGGQSIDVESEKKRLSLDEAQMLRMYAMKTGALLTGAARDDLRGVAGIAPYDFGKAYLAAMADPSGAQAYEQVMGQPLPELKLETPDVLLKDLEAHAQQWCFDNQIDRLAGKNVLVFGFDRDDASTMEMHILPFIEKARPALGDKLRFENYNTDHSYNDKRVAVARALAQWIEDCVK